jgi:hypothetical protein
VHAFLTSALKAGERLDSCTGRTDGGEISPVSQWIGHWGFHGRCTCYRTKPFPSPAGNQIPISRSSILVSIFTQLSRLQRQECRFVILTQHISSFIISLGFIKEKRVNEELVSWRGKGAYFEAVQYLCEGDPITA